MATREENQKKINEELEKLDDEQLEQIAGGRMMQMIEQNQETDTAQNIFQKKISLRSIFSCQKSVKSF